MILLPYLNIMKSKYALAGRFLTILAALAVAGLAVPLHAEKSEKGVVKVVRMKGNARYSTDQKTWKDLKQGKLLKSGTLVQTAPNSIVDICLNDARDSSSGGMTENSVDNVLRLFENCTVGLDKLTTEEIQLDLRNGTIMGTVGKLTSQAKYEMKLPHGLVGIRGGTYIVDSSGVVNVIEGSAIYVVIAADNSLATKKIGQHQGYDPTTGSIVPLHLEMYPQPLTCGGSELPSTSPSTPSSGKPHGSGMGGALRKF